MSNVINNTGDSELNESPQGFINSDAFDDNDTLNLVNEFPCLNEDSTILQDIELHSKKNLTDCNIKKQETISSSLYEKFENIYLGQKRKKKKKDNTDIQHKKNENLKGKTISKSKAININEFKNISDFGTTQETSNQKDKTVTNEND